VAVMLTPFHRRSPPWLRSFGRARLEAGARLGSWSEDDVLDLAWLDDDTLACAPVGRWNACAHVGVVATAACEAVMRASPQPRRSME
jgi:hypothetical protein